MATSKQSSGVFGTDEVVSLILAYSDVFGAMTTTASYRAWSKVAAHRLRDRFEGTGLSVDSASRAFGDMSIGCLDAIFRTMGGPVRPRDKNSFDGLVFAVSLVVDGKERMLRFLDTPSSIDYSSDKYSSELRLTFQDLEIPTQSLSTPPTDGFWHGQGAAQLFVDENVVKDELILKIAAYDRKRNRVADVFYGAANESIVPLNDYEDEFKHYNYGCAFQGSEDEKNTRAAMYFDAKDMLPRDGLPGGYLPELDEALGFFIDWTEFDAWVRQFCPPIGTNFTTLELTFENVDDIDHLKSVLTWRPPFDSPFD